MYRGPKVTTTHHEEDREEEEEDEEECTVFQKKMKEEKEEEMLDSRSNSSEQSVEEEHSEEEPGQPSLSFVTVEDEIIGVGRVVEEEGEESENEEDSKVEAHTFKVEEKRKEEDGEDEGDEGIHLHFKMDTTLRAKDRVYISSYGNQVCVKARHPREFKIFAVF